ncbi:MAG: pyrroline-5-carboxylate reductase [Alphaproteobacteria bacterium]|nr:pyrroline-5-carboxylate reductase [Alphaproteobacteria bacterium]
MGALLVNDSFANNQKIWVVGGGKLGQAIVKGWLLSGINPDRLGIIDPKANNKAFFQDIPDSIYRCSPDHLPELKNDKIVLAVKPQIMLSILPAYQKAAVKGCDFLSVAAGITTDVLQQHLNTPMVMRAMPNLPVAFGCGFIGCYVPSGANPTISRQWIDLLEKLGLAITLLRESDLDTVTALSGSAPAYLFLVAEILTSLAEQQGLPTLTAKKMIAQTFLGSAMMMRQDKFSLAALREQVTSPKGTTAAALEVLMGSSGLQPLFSQAVAAAITRARQLKT